MAYHRPRTLTLTHSDGHSQRVSVYCGSAKWARKLPRGAGRALVEGRATAVLDYDGLPRTAILNRGSYYMRIAR